MTGLSVTPLLRLPVPALLYSRSLPIADTFSMVTPAKMPRYAAVSNDRALRSVEARASLAKASSSTISTR